MRQKVPVSSSSRSGRVATPGPHRSSPPPSPCPSAPRRGGEADAAEAATLDEQVESDQRLPVPVLVRQWAAHLRTSLPSPFLRVAPGPYDPCTAESP